MTELSKAFLQQLDNRNQPAPGKAAVPVQFNPSSLRLQYANQSEGGRSAGRQARQHTGNSSVTLSVDLVFDTADEGSSEVPRSVLERTREIEVFITPQAVAGRNQAPPRLRFQWGDVIVDGVLESLSVDIDHFAHTGTPLRAKASLSIKGQDAERQANQSGAGAHTAGGAPAQAGAGSGSGAGAGLPGAASPAGAAAGLLGGGLGGALARGLGTALQGLSLVNSVGRALDGESLSLLAVRNGLPPEAWRALGAGVSDPTRLPAGTEVAIPKSASANAGAGSSQGVQAGTSGAAPTSAAQRVGLGATPSNSALGALQKGYALAAAGGLGAALENVKADAGAAGATQARRNFEGVGGDTAAAVDALSSAAATPGQRQQVFSLRADTRAQAFGRNVPLRDRVQVSLDDRANLLSGQAVLKRATSLLPPTTSDPGVPGWVALHQGAGQPSGGGGPAHASGCRCGCGH